jgi:hypothetical protein
LRFERPIETQATADHLVPNLPLIVTGLDLEVALEEVDHRQVARRLAVRDRGGFQDEPALQAMGARELVDDARLAHPRLADDRRHLTATVTGELLDAQHAARQVLNGYAGIVIADGYGAYDARARAGPSFTLAQRPKQG